MRRATAGSAYSNRIGGPKRSLFGSHGIPQMIEKGLLRRICGLVIKDPERDFGISVFGVLNRIGFPLGSHPTETCRAAAGRARAPLRGSPSACVMLRPQSAAADQLFYIRSG